MKYVLVWLLLVASASAVQIGDTYEQVIAEKGTPKSQASAGGKRILNYPDGSVHVQNNAVVLIKLSSKAPARSDPAPSKPEEKAAPETQKAPADPLPATESLSTLENQRQSAINRVKSIVNRPVKPLKRTDRMKVFMFSPGWFHDGANVPDFLNVDVRKTQEFSYDNAEYVCSDLDPEIVFVGRELEFNPMIKYFYVDRTVPKRKLSESEMVEINRLYRVIGKCTAQLKRLEAQ
ncbi:MAG: hypothetical protein ABIZ04_19455 [Opitutus sp.]